MLAPRPRPLVTQRRSVRLPADVDRFLTRAAASEGLSYTDALVGAVRMTMRTEQLVRLEAANHDPELRALASHSGEHSPALDDDPPAPVGRDAESARSITSASPAARL